MDAYINTKLPPLFLNKKKICSICRPLFFQAAVFLVLFLSGCTDTSSTSISSVCVSSEIQITATLPAGSFDLTKNDPPALVAQSLRSRAFFVAPNMLMTVAHALPKTAFLRGFSEKKRDSKRDILWLKSDLCGIPLVLSKEAIKLNDELFDCETKESFGRILRFEDRISENIFITNRLSGLAVLHYPFSLGDSGKPMCNRAGEVLGLLVAIDSGEAFVTSIL